MKEKLITWGLGGLLTVLIGLNVWWFMTGDKGNHALVDKPAPEVALPTLADGKPSGPPFKLSDHKGQVVLLDFWAVYCGPCKRQMPILEEIKADMADEDVHIVSVNTDDPRQENRLQKVQAFVDRGGFSLPIALDSGKTAYHFNVQRIPTLVLVDREGTVRFVHTGVSSKEELSAQIRELLDAKPAAGA